MVHPSDALTLCGNFVLLRTGGLRLLLPQRDVAETVYRSPQLEEPGRGSAAFASAGSIARATVPQDVVWALDEDLRRLPQVPADRFVLTRLHAVPACLFAWDDVDVLIGTELNFHPLPALLRHEDGPIEAYAQWQQDLVFCTTSERLAAALEASEQGR